MKAIIPVEDLARVNSLTKYPSIPTYHTLGARGVLTDRALAFPAGPVIGSEKVDGTNTRIVLWGDDYVIGSREELLTARGDRLANPSQGIVAAVRYVAERCARWHGAHAQGALHVVYGEVYGHGVGANGKQYGGPGAVGFRVFDVMSMGLVDLANVLLREPREIAAWRDAGGQPFLGEDDLLGFAQEYGLDVAPRFPMGRGGLPTGHQETLNWLRATIPATSVALDAAAGGRPEGLVVRAPDRSVIAKIRYEDYERTVRARARG